MSGIFSIAMAFFISISGSWVFAKIFSVLYILACLPMTFILFCIQKTVPESYQNWALNIFAIFSKIFGYYIACIWPAFIVTWLIIPNLPTAPWWIYGIALGGFITASCIDIVTFSALAIFCFKPELINLFYSWVPFHSIFLSPMF